MDLWLICSICWIISALVCLASSFIKKCPSIVTYVSWCFMLLFCALLNIAAAR
jgi:hypothetical protein